MARVDDIMPQMGESIAEGTVSRWLKRVGDEVKRDEPLFEISTDKVDAEIPSPSAGVLAEILVTEGSTVEVQTVVARIETEKGGDVHAAGTPAPPPAAASEAPAFADAGSRAAAPRVVAPGASLPAPHAVPHAARSAPNGTFEERVRTRSSPLVRRMAAEHGVEISGLQGTGIAGRVTKRDLMGFLEGGAPAATSAASPGGPAGAIAVPAAEHAVPSAVAWPGDVVEPMSKLRRLTSEHMAHARRVAAHVTTVHEIDLTRASRVRAAMRDAFEAQVGQKLTHLPFVLQAVVMTLKRHPMLNAAVNGTDVIYRKRYNIGIAVALDPTGLIVPVIKHAEDLSLSGLAKASNELATRARAKKLGPADAADATFTISNFGVFGSVIGTPIIPAGTTAILGLGVIEKRPKVITGADGEDTIAIRTCAYFSLSFDHRVVDGADADRFMGDLKQTLQTIPEAGF